MNAIFAVVFLAACAAAQFDTTTDLNKILLKSRWNNKDLSIVELLRSTGLVGNTRVATPWVLPTSYYNKVDTRSVLTLDEIVRQPLFQQYLTLPLFRQHLTHQLFQYFLTTPLFQTYWTIPEFQTFFTNPYKFYKYIYPVVYNTRSTLFDQVNVDTLYPVDRTLVDGVMDKDVLSQLVTRKNVLPVDSELINNRYINNMNTMNINRLPIDSIYGQEIINRNHLPYTYVMDKIFKNNIVNRPITEVVTDVKVLGDNVDQQTYKIVDGKIIPVVGDRKVVLDDIIARRPIDRSMIVDDLLVRKPTMNMIDDLLVRKPTMNIVDDLLVRKPTTMIDDLLVRKPTMNMIDDLLVRKPTTMIDDLLINKPTMIDQLLKEEIPMEKFNKIGQHMNVKDAILKRLLLNKVMYGDRKIDELFPEFTTEMKNMNIPIFEKIEKINKMNRLENMVEKINGVDKLETLPTTTFDEMIRTPVTSDLLRTVYNKDLLTRVPLTKEIMKDFTFETPMMTTQDKIFNDNTNMFKTLNLEKPTTKTVIV